MLKKFIYFLNIIAALGLLTSYLSPFIDPTLNSYLPLFGLVFPVFIFVNFLFPIYWIIKKEYKRSFLSILFLLFGIFAILRTLQFNNKSSLEKHGIDIMSYNVRGIHMAASNKADVKKVNKFIEENNEVEIFCIQEKRKNEKSVFSKVLNNLYKAESNFGTAIYSRLPIVNKGIVKINGNTKEAIWADIKTNSGQLIRVYSFHLSSNRISSATDEIIKKAKLNDKKTWYGIKSLFGKYSYYAIKRKEQIDILNDHIKKSPHPVILAGDLNDVPQSYAYRAISQNKNDSFIEKGSAMGNTFGEKIALLRIDYIFPQKIFEVQSHKVLKSDFSDHYPIVCRLSYPKS